MNDDAPAKVAAERLRRFIASLHGGVLAEDEDRRILFVNPSFLKMFGIDASPDDLVGVDCSGAAEQSKSLFQEPDAFVARVGEILRHRQPVTAELLHLADGRVFERDYVPVDVDDRARGHLWHYRDVTEIRALLDRLERTADARSAFLSSMSHEIRTPMNGVVGMLELLGHSRPTPEQSELIGIARASADALLRIIDDILDFTKMEAGKVSFEAAPVDLGEVLGDLVEAVRPTARAKGLALTLGVQPDMPRSILIDPDRLRRIVGNLLGNALKFTEDGYVAVEARVAQHDASAVEIVVSDSGIGIAPEALPRIFDKFTQADPSVTRRYGGTGLGLAITRQLVELFGGRIDVDTKVGVGSTFVVTLPVRDVLSFRAPSDRHEPPPTGLRALVVEDDTVNQQVARRMLERLGCEVRLAGDGREGVEVAASEDFDIVFMDCHMPRVDGYQATRQLRAPPYLCRTPIVALTAAILPEDEARCRAAGMDDFVTKPVRIDELKACLLRWCAPGYRRTKATVPTLDEEPVPI